MMMSIIWIAIHIIGSCMQLYLHEYVQYHILIVYQSALSTLYACFCINEISCIVFKVVVAYWKVKTPCHAHGECIN